MPEYQTDECPCGKYEFCITVCDHNLDPDTESEDMPNLFCPVCQADLDNKIYDE